MITTAERESLVLEFRSDFFEAPRRVRWPIFAHPGGQQLAGSPRSAEGTLREALRNYPHRPSYMIRVLPKEMR